jgi:hypothetical protein
MHGSGFKGVSAPTKGISPRIPVALPVTFSVIFFVIQGVLAEFF